MKKTKKLLALAMATAMALTPATVFAADTEATASPATGSAVGDGSVEGVVDKEVFTVVVPTVAANTFDFILDPQNLINDSKTANAAKSAYGSATFSGNSGLYFKNTDGNYSNESDELTIKSKSSMEVNVNLEVSVTSAAGVSFTPDKTFADDTTPSVYLGLINSKDTVTATTPDAVDAATLKASADVTMAAVAEDKFEVKYATNKYTYALKSGVTDDDFDTMTFKITGAANKAADWKGLEDATPEIKVVWTISKANDATEGICLLVGSTFWIGPDKADNTKNFGANPVISDVKVNGHACAHSVTDNYLVISWDQIVAAGAGNDSSWTVTATVNGVNYTATYTQ